MDLELIPEGRGFVYLLGENDMPGFYKIGVTRGELKRRIKKLQTGNSSKLYVCGFYKTEHPFFIEQCLHTKYKYCNVLNEWYELPDNEAFNFQKTCEDLENLIEIMKDNPFFPKKIN